MAKKASSLLAAAKKLKPRKKCLSWFDKLKDPDLAAEILELRRAFIAGELPNADSATLCDLLNAEPYKLGLSRPTFSRWLRSKDE